ncbi:hypothetical protein [Oceanotoga phage vB_OteS-UFV02]
MNKKIEDYLNSAIKFTSMLGVEMAKLENDLDLEDVDTITVKLETISKNLDRITNLVFLKEVKAVYKDSLYEDQGGIL